MNRCGVPPKRILLTSDRDVQNSQDSAFSSHIMSSQVQDSQCSDFSQIATQDMFSQNNSVPQNEKKMSMYEKWLSKRAMFKRDPPHPGSVDNKINVQGTIVNQPSSIIQTPNYFGSSGNINTLTRPTVDPCLKGSERELLRHVTFAIHDCSSEMKSALLAVKEKLENVTDMTNEQLAQILTSFLDDIWKHQEKLKELLQEQDKGRSLVTDLEVKLAKKESQIAILEEQLVQAKKDDTPRLAKAVRCEMQSPQLLMQQKLEEIIDWTKDAKEQQDHHLKEYKHSMEAQCKQYLNLNKTGHSNSKETEKRILSELRKVPDKIESKQRELHSQLKEDVKNCLQIYQGDFEDTMKHSIKDCLNQHIREHEKVITTLQKDGIQDIFKTQLEIISGKLGDVINSHTIKNNEQMTNIQGTLNESVQYIQELLQAKCLETGAIAQIETRLTNFQSGLTQQLITIGNRNSAEIMELENKFYKHLKYSADKGTTQEQENITDTPGITAQSDRMKGTTSDFANPHLSLGQMRNNSLLDTACSQVNTTMSKISADASKNSNSSAFVDSNDFHKNLQIYRQGLNNCHRQLSEITNSSMNQFAPTSTYKVCSFKTPTHLKQAAKVPKNLLNQYAVSCHPHDQCKVPVSFKLKSSPAVVPYKHECYKNASSQHFMSKQNVTQPGDIVISPQPNEKDKKISGTKKNSRGKYVENMTVIHTQARNSPHTRRWTRSHYKSVKEIQAAPHEDFQRACQVAGNGCKFIGNQKYSWLDSQGNSVKHNKAKGELSVYDYHESDACNLPVVSRKRNHISSETAKNMSRATFSNNRFIERSKNANVETDSECSSPTISITEMTIRRKVRTPFRRSLCTVILPNRDFVTEHSPAPTLLSDIGSKK